MDKTSWTYSSYMSKKSCLISKYTHCVEMNKTSWTYKMKLYDGEKMKISDLGGKGKVGYCIKYG